MRLSVVFPDEEWALIAPHIYVNERRRTTGPYPLRRVFSGFALKRSRLRGVVAHDANDLHRRGMWCMTKVNVGCAPACFELIGTGPAHRAAFGGRAQPRNLLPPFSIAAPCNPAPKWGWAVMRRCQSASGSPKRLHMAVGTLGDLG